MQDPEPVQPPVNRMPAIEAALFAGRKIEAIKLHREMTGMGLAESKAAVEAIEIQLRQTNPMQFTKQPTGKGCSVGCILMFAIITATLYTFIR